MPISLRRHMAWVFCLFGSGTQIKNCCQYVDTKDRKWVMRSCESVSQRLGDRHSVSRHLFILTLVGKSFPPRTRKAESWSVSVVDFTIKWTNLYSDLLKNLNSTPGQLLFFFAVWAQKRLSTCSLFTPFDAQYRLRHVHQSSLDTCLYHFSVSS